MSVYLIGVYYRRTSRRMSHGRASDGRMSYGPISYGLVSHRRIPHGHVLHGRASHGRAPRERHHEQHAGFSMEIEECLLPMILITLGCLEETTTSKSQIALRAQQCKRRQKAFVSRFIAIFSAIIQCLLAHLGNSPLCAPVRISLHVLCCHCCCCCCYGIILTTGVLLLGPPRRRRVRVLARSCILSSAMSSYPRKLATACCFCFCESCRQALLPVASSDHLSH
jgi:hypothetical protein